MDLARNRGAKIRGGRSTAKDPKVKKREGTGHYNRSRRGGRGGGYRTSPSSHTNSFSVGQEHWPELPDTDPWNPGHPKPADFVDTDIASIENQEPVTAMEDWGTEPSAINTEWGSPSEEEKVSVTKAPNFDINEFMERNPDLRDMELAIVSAINTLFKQKMLSNEDQALLMYQQSALTTYKPSMTPGSFYYPGIPLYSVLAEILEEWIYSGACYAKELITYDLLDEGNGIEKRKMVLDNITCHMMGIRDSWEGLETDEKKHKITQLFKDIGKRGILDLLGVRRTVGTQDIIPPTRDVLEASFRELNKSSSQLTVGARALEKHFHRDHSNSWWGKPKGSEKAKNENAEGVLKKILNDVGWLNIHQLPHALPILEIRCTEGYGARWSPDGKEFRGFLEPPMVAGWETGYKH